MTCRADLQRRAGAATRELRDRDSVQEVHTIGPAQDPHGTVCLDVVLVPSAGGVPPAICETATAHGLTVRDVQRQGDYWQALLVA